FVQAEDGIRDDLVTGVQTCALPISSSSILATGKEAKRKRSPDAAEAMHRHCSYGIVNSQPFQEFDAQDDEHTGEASQQYGPSWRSEERRVGKECSDERRSE